MLLLLFLHSAQSVKMLQPFGNLSLSSGNTLTMELLDYFSGMDLSYSISPPSPTKLELITSPEFKLSTTMRPSKPILQNLRIEEMPVMSAYTVDYLFSYSKNELICLKFYINEGVTDLLWRDEIKSDYSDFSLTSVSLILINETDNFVLLFGVGFDSQLNLVNDFYIVNVTNPHVKRSYQRISLEDLKFIKNLQIHRIFHSNIVSFFSTVSGIILVYDVSRFKDCVLIQTIQKYYTIPYYPGAKIAPLSVMILGSTNVFEKLVVLDEAFGLIAFSYENGYFFECQFMDMSLYGSFILMKSSVNKVLNQNMLMISTTTGVLIVDFVQMAEIGIVGSFDNNGYNTNVVGIFSYLNFMYFLSIQDSNTLMIQINSLNYPTSPIMHKMLQYLGLNVNGQWEFIPSSQVIHFIHIDFDEIRTFTYTPSTPKLYLKSFYQNEVYNITATDLYQQTTQSQLTITSLTSNNYDILLLLDGEIYNKPMSYAYTFSSQNAIIEIPTLMFSGWNLTCGLQDAAIFKDSIKIQDITSPKVSRYFTYSIANYTKPIVNISKGYIIIMDVYNVTIIQIETQKYQVFGIPSAVQAKSVLLPNNVSAILVLQPLDFGCNCYMIVGSTYSVISSNIIKCNYLEVIPNYLIIGNSLSIGISYFDSKSGSFLNLTTSILNVFPPKTIAGLETSRCITYINCNLLYILMKNSIGIINLDTYSEDNFIVKFNNRTLLPGYISFKSNSYQVSVSFSNKIVVYDLFLSQILRVIPISAVSMFSLEDFLIASTLSYYYLIDTSQPYLVNSVYYIGVLNETIVGMTSGLTKSAYIVTSLNNTLAIYTSGCPISNSTCTYPIIINASFTGVEYDSLNIFNTNFKIECKNEQSSLASDVEYEFVTYGLEINQINETSNEFVDYDTERIFYFADFFSGYDMQAVLYLNGKPSYEYENPPAYLVPSVIKLAQLSNGYSLVDQSIIKFTNYLIALSQSSVILVIDTRSGLPVNSFSIPENSPYFNLSCFNSIHISNQESSALILLSCSYFENYPSSIGQTASVEKPLLVTFILDTNSFAPSAFEYFLVPYIPTLINVISANARNFVVLIIDGQADGSIQNNHLVVMKGVWQGSMVQIQFNQTINFFTLGLGRFLAVTLDGKYNYLGQLHLYVVDYWYGLRVLSNVYSSQIALVDSFPLNKQTFSIGLCGSLLFLGLNDTTLMVFVAKQETITFSVTYYPFNSASLSYSAIQGYIKCSDYYNPDFVMLPINSNDTYYVRIIDLDADFSSSVVRDVNISTFSSRSMYKSIVDFLDHNTFIGLDTSLGIINKFSIQESLVVIPQLSDSAYAQLQSEANTTKFSAYVHVFNGKSSLNSTLTTLTRSHEVLESSSSSSPPSILLILVLCSGVMTTLVAIVIIIYRTVLKKRQRQLFSKSLVIN